MSQHTLCAVMGNPIAHSLSPAIHELFAKQTNKNLTYVKICADSATFEQEVTEFFAKGGLGLNITQPFKTRAYQLSDCPTPRCQEAQAANTLWCKDHKIYADNTDGIGLVRDLRRIMPLAHKRILIVGAGGAALGIIPALYQAQVQHIEVHNRSAARLQALLAQFPQVNIKPVDPITSKVDLIINATSSQNTAFTSLNQAFKDKPPCYDLSYDLHHPTYFVQHAKAQRCVAYDGLGMLIEQAAESFWRWHGVKPDTTAMSHQLRLKKSLHLIAGR